MSIISVLKEALGINGAVVKDIQLNLDGDLLVFVTIKKLYQHRCGKCKKKCRHFDNGRKETRMWRAMDFGGFKVFIVAEMTRIICLEHGVVTCNCSMGGAQFQIHQGF